MCSAVVPLAATQILCLGSALTLERSSARRPGVFGTLRVDLKPERLAE